MQTLYHLAHDYTIAISLYDLLRKLLEDQVDWEILKNRFANK